MLGDLRELLVIARADARSDGRVQSAPAATRLSASCEVQRFKFRTVRQDAGETHPAVIPVGPRHGMDMLVESIPAAAPASQPNHP